MTLSTASWLTRRCGFVEAEADGGLMMMSVESGQYYDLNATAAFLWRALSQPRQLQELFAMVRAEYEVSEGVCTDAVTVFVQRMFDDGLLQCSEAMPACGPTA